jgi:hypothetical protein
VFYSDPCARSWSPPSGTSNGRAGAALFAAVVALPGSAWAQLAPAVATARVEPAAPFLPKQITGYIQTDYVVSAESRDQLNDGNQLNGPGVLNAQGQLAGAAGQSGDANALVLNQNRFFLRRARLRLADRYERGSFAGDYALQVDANTIAGPALGLRDAEIGLTWTLRARQEAKSETIVVGGGHSDGRERDLRIRVGAGMFRSPFGYDTYQLSHAARLFSEPALLANAFFPGDYDLGVRVQADYRAMYVVAALQNGEPIGGRGLPGRDPNSAKDWFLRLGGRSNIFERVTVEGAVSLTRGSGFHAGTPPTKDSLVWRDFNEDGIAQPAEIQVIRGASATASENFLRWGIGADLRVHIAIPLLGQLMLFGEAATAVNLDRGLRPADPVVSGAPQRGIGLNGGFVQELGKWFFIGARADHYNARLDASETQGGVLVRASEPFTHYAFAGAFRFLERERFTGGGRLMVEYAVRRDRLGRDASGTPADLSDNRLTFRMQWEL